MKRFQRIAPLLLATLLAAILAGCTTSSTVFTLGSTDDAKFSNGDFDVTVYESVVIGEADLGDRSISLTEEALDTYQLYEVRLRYTNQMSEPSHLSYRRLWLSFPGVENPGEDLMLAGFCEPRAADPQGYPTFCAYVPPPPAPGRYGVTGVFQASSVQVEPGEEARLYLIVVVNKDQSELEISFVEPED